MPNETKYCIAPFTDFSISSGVAHPCACDTWVNRKFWFNHNINIPNDTINTINHPLMHMFRDGIRRGDATICYSDTCPHKKMYSLQDLTLNKPKLPKQVQDAIIDFLSYKSHVYATLPCNYKLDYDGSCNLICPTCRTSQCLNSRSEHYNQFINNVIPILKHTQTLIITGTGDPFASPHYGHILKVPLPVSSMFTALSIMSNGMLFDEQHYNNIYYKDKLHNAYISVDAVTAQTYHKIRIGGSWEKLQNNLNFLLALRESTRLNKLYVNFVIQQHNILEVEAFVDWAIAYKFDGIYFNIPWIFNSKTIDIESISVQLLQHPKHNIYKRMMLKIKDKPIQMIFSRNPMY